MTAVVAAMDQSQADGTALLVLLAIARSADRRTGEAYLSMAELARRARVDHRNARRAVRCLEGLGELHANIQAGRGGTNLYRVEIAGAVEDPPGGSARGEGGSAPGGRAPAPGGEGGSARGPRAPAPPGEVLRDTGEGEREGAAGEPAAAEPPTGAVGATGHGLRPGPAVAPASPAGAGRSARGLVPPLTPFRPLGDGFDLKTWERTLRRTQAGAHNGMAEEWADLCTEARADTWDDAAAVVRELVRRFKLDNPGWSKAVASGQCVGYLDHGRDLMQRRRRATETPAAAAPPTPAVPEPESTPAKRARRLAGDLTAMESYLITNGKRILNADGDLIPIGA